MQLLCHCSAKMNCVRYHLIGYRSVRVSLYLIIEKQVDVSLE